MPSTAGFVGALSQMSRIASIASGESLAAGFTLRSSASGLHPFGINSAHCSSRTGALSAAATEAPAARQSASEESGESSGWYSSIRSLARARRRATGDRRVLRAAGLRSSPRRAVPRSLSIPPSRAPPRAG